MVSLYKARTLLLRLPLSQLLVSVRFFILVFVPEPPCSPVRMGSPLESAYGHHFLSYLENRGPDGPQLVIPRMGCSPHYDAHSSVATGDAICHTIISRYKYSKLKCLNFRCLNILNQSVQISDILKCLSI